MVDITRHALARYQQRVCGIPDDEISARLKSHPFDAAADFAGSATVFVALGTGQRVVISVRAIVTVLPAMPRHHFARQIQARGVMP